MSYERRAYVRASAIYNIYHAARHARFREYLDQRVGRERRIFGRLDDHRIAADQSRHDLPRRYSHGEIPWRDQRADTKRLSRGHRKFPRQFRRPGLTEEAAARPSR